MGNGTNLVQVIHGQLADLRGRVLLLCAPALASQLVEADPSAGDRRYLLVDHSTSAKKLARLAAEQPLLRAHPTELPLAPRCAAAVVAVDTLGLCAPADETLVALCQVLRPDGRLISAERVLRSPTLRALRRLSHPASRRLLPQQVCSLMLNARLTEIGQRWPEGYPQRFVSYGSLRVI